MENTTKEYVGFKLDQHCRITGFDYKVADAREKLTQIMNSNLKSWVSEALSAGCVN